jgi:hypothetical protein
LVTDDPGGKDREYLRINKKTNYLFRAWLIQVLTATKSEQRLMEQLVVRPNTRLKVSKNRWEQRRWKYFLTFVHPEKWRKKRIMNK